MAQRKRTRKPVSPGEVLHHEFLEPTDLSQTALARHIGCDPKTINRIVNGRTSITPKMARLLASALGTSERFWLNLQTAVDLYEVDQDIEDLPPRISQFADRSARG